MLYGLLLLITIASPLPNPQTGSHIPQSPESRLSTGPGRDRDTNVWEWTVAGPKLAGAGQARDSAEELLAGTGGRGMA